MPHTTRETRHPASVVLTHLSSHRGGNVFFEDWFEVVGIGDVLDGRMKQRVVDGYRDRIHLVSHRLLQKTFTETTHESHLP